MHNARRVAPLVYAAIIVATLLIFPGQAFGIVCIVGGVLLAAFYVGTQPKNGSPNADRAARRASRRDR